MFVPVNPDHGKRCLVKPLTELKFIFSVVYHIPVLMGCMRRQFKSTTAIKNWNSGVFLSRIWQSKSVFTFVVPHFALEGRQRGNNFLLDCCYFLMPVGPPGLLLWTGCKYYFFFPAGNSHYKEMCLMSSAIFSWVYFCGIHLSDEILRGFLRFQDTFTFSHPSNTTRSKTE